MFKNILNNIVDKFFKCGSSSGGGSGSVGKQSKSELVGTWQENTEIQPYKFTIDDNGDIKFTLSEHITSYYYYTGKIADTFDYPYIVEIVADFKGETSKGKFTFNNEKSCHAVFYVWDMYSGKFNPKKSEIDFIKQ